MAKEADQSALKQLKADLKAGTPANLYIFHGEEMFLLNHYLQMLKNCVVDSLTESFNYHRFTAETFDLRAFADAVENLPMMAERTMVQVDEIDFFRFPEDNREVMAQILGDIPEYCTVVFTYETVAFKPDKRYKKLCDAMNAGQCVEFAKQNQRELVTWMQRHFAASKKTISPDLCAYLMELTDGTMTSLAGEIKKITAYSAADAICKADIDAVTEPVLDAVMYRMTDQLSAGDYGAALQTLHKLLKMQEEPLGILGAIGAHFRRLSVARMLQDHGRNYAELMKLCEIRSDYTAKKAMEACRRFTPAFYKKTAELVLETDRKFKTSVDSAQRLLEMLILQLAQEAKHG